MSNGEDPTQDDLLAGLLLARWADMHSPDGTVPLDVVPCFQNNVELRHAAPLLKALMQNSAGETVGRLLGGE